jgi:flavin reductase (DIM6/NTAB) family NADH-FMN oxidoreductase RutF
MNNQSLFQIPYGVFLVTTSFNDNLGGCVSNEFIQITDYPTNFVLSLNKNSHTADLITKSNKCIIGLISENCDINIIKHFFEHTGNIEDKFDIKYSNIFTYKIVNDMPCLDKNILYNLICDVSETIDMDTNYIFILKLKDAIEISKFSKLMTNEIYKEKISKLDEFDNINKEKSEPSKHARTSFICTMCTYIYDGDIPFEELPDDYKCPKCGKSKDYFIEKYLI